MPHKVVFAPEARNDLRELYLFVAERAGDATAIAYIDRIKSFCTGFADFPKRGTQREDLLPGLRVVGFEGRISLAFHVGTDTVTFDRILYGGRDLPF